MQKKLPFITEITQCKLLFKIKFNIVVSRSKFIKCFSLLQHQSHYDTVEPKIPINIKYLCSNLKISNNHNLKRFP